MENWNEINSKEKSEEINIEKQPKAREIKITTKKILKKKLLLKNLIKIKMMK